MKQIILMLLSIITFGWLGNFYFNDGNESPCTYKKWVKIPLIISSTMLAIFLLVCGALLWYIFLEVSFILWGALLLLVLIAGASSFVVGATINELKKTL